MRVCQGVKMLFSRKILRTHLKDDPLQEIQKIVTQKSNLSNVIFIRYDVIV